MRRARVAPKLNKQEFIANQAWERLDLFVTERAIGMTRSQVRRLVGEGLILLNGLPAKASHNVRAGDRVSLTILPLRPTHLVPEEIPLNVVFQDEHLLVVEKPAGLTVHPAPGHSSHTLVDALLALCPDLKGIGGEVRPGIVHRLDKDTSGLMVVAKTSQVHVGLTQQLRDRKVTKAYLALATGRLNQPEGVIDAPIGRDPRNRKRMAVVRGGRDAITRYRVLQHVGDNDYVEASPETGRTHQIRVHFGSIGHPLFGDSVYGKKSGLVNRHFLHAHGLAFQHPATGKRVEFTSNLPEELEQVLALLRD